MHSLSSAAIPQEYSYVLASLVASALVSQYHTVLVGSLRKRAKVPYPNAYATAEDASKDAEKFRFNCAQRAHSNYLENFAIAFPAFLASSLVYPTVASSFFGIWLVGRIAYTAGYVSSQHNSTGRGRFKGGFYLIAQLGLAITAGMSAWKVFSTGV